MKINRYPTRGRAPLFFGVTIACAGAILSGCMSSPTYGTGKTANAQLMEDLSGVLTIGPGSRKKAQVAYNPRAELVRPASLEVLPEPQQDMASSGNPAWPESPEQRRARLRQEATANHDNPNYRSPITAGSSNRLGSEAVLADERSREGARLTDAQRADLEKRMRDANQGDSNVRRYLSEPPLEYRVPADSAASGELGEDEWKKSRRQKKAGGKTSWRDYVPGL